MRNGATMANEQLDTIAAGRGFIAALDQSGGSTPKALGLYGIADDAYSGDEQMFDLIHQMRARIITSPSLGGDRVIGAILFQQTIDRQIDGRDTADYLWSVKRVVPFLKVDQGLDDPASGVRLMSPIDGLEGLLAHARGKGVFGTKMRSVIEHADPAGIAAIVEQQFEVGLRILGAGLVPILEPEIDIHSPTRAQAEALLKADLLAQLEELPEGQQVMFKLTLPDHDDFYRELIDHPRVLKVVALSGGYTREQATARLARNPQVIASFSRALTEGLSADQTDEEFDAVLDASIASIYEASIT
ncbi:MAG TPA: fructose bisphosphate aldolase [Nitriliruptorales bacterium]